MIRPAIVLAALIVVFALFVDAYQAVHLDLHPLEGEQP